MRGVLRVLGVLSALVLIPVAHAVPAAAQGDASRDPGYRRALEGAVSEYAAGNYAEARALFVRAHAIYPNARTLRGIGMAAFELRDYVAASRALRASLESQTRPLGRDHRSQVSELLERTKAFVGRFVVRISPEGATLRVDGVAPTLEDDGALLLDLGEHELTVDCEACQRLRRTIEVRGGEEEEIALAAVPRVDEGPAVGPAASGSAAAGSVDTGGASPIPFFVTAGALAVGAVAGVLWWLDRNSEIDRCDGAGEFCFNRDELGTQRTGAVAATVAMSAGAVGLGVVGLVVMVTGADEPATAAACAPTLGGAHCALRF